VAISTITARACLKLSLGNRSAWSTYNKRQLEEKNAEASLVNVRQLIIVGVREAVRRVQTDFKRIETTRSARIMAEKQLQAEQERLKVGSAPHASFLIFNAILRRPKATSYAPSSITTNRSPTRAAQGHDTRPL